MASSKKKRVDEEEMEDDIDDDDVIDDDDDIESDSDDEQEAMDQEIQLDLEARTPDDSDFNGIRTLLQQVFLKAHINVSELADTIISQNYIGSVMKQPYSPEDDDDDDDDDDSDMTVLALTTVVNITERKNLDCVKQMKSMLSTKCNQCAKGQHEKFNKLLNDPDHHVGYLVSERFLNLPPTMAVPMFESLMKEMEKAKQKNMKYDFSHYLMVCKTFEMKAAHNVKQIMYSNSEEELFEEVADVCFKYSVAHERDSCVEKWSSEDGMEPFRNVIIFPADKLSVIVDKIKQEVGNT
ncbi:hypothetical protein ACF0H5_008888 [Mactra antiquata]